MIRPPSFSHGNRMAVNPVPSSPVSIAQASPKSPASVASTTIFQEDFESAVFPPAGWKMVDADGGGTSAAWFLGNTTVFTAYHGSGYAAANYQGANDFLIDQWLISPQITSISSADTLTFWQRSPDNTFYPDSVEVRISTTDTARSSFTVKLDYFRTSTSGWAQNRYPLNNYVPAGSNIYIAFRYLLYDAGVSGLSSDYVGIDLVQIVRPALAHDVTVASVDFPYPGSKQITGQSISPQATVENVGSSAESNVLVRMHIVPPSGSAVDEDQTISSIAPGQSVPVQFSTYLLSEAGQYSVVTFTSLGTDMNTRNDTLRSSFRGSVLLSGTYTVGTGGAMTTLSSAVDSINHSILSGAVVLSLVSSSYSEPPLTIGPLDYQGAVQNVTIRPVTGLSSTVTIATTPADPFGILVQGTSHLTFDGLSGAASQRNLVIRATGLYATTGIMIRGTSGAYADSNLVRNVLVRNGADSLASSSGFYGILLSGFSSSYPDNGNRVANCDVGSFGSAGIAMQWQQGAVVEQNYVHDWNQHAGANDVTGILLADGTVNAVVRGNTVTGITTMVNNQNAAGIDNAAGTASAALICNNAVSRIRSSGSGTSPNYTRAIVGSNIANSGDRYYYNSIYLTGADSSTSPVSRSSGIELAGGSSVTLCNNAVVNEMTLAGSQTGNRAYCVYCATLPGGFTSDHNDWYAPGAQGMVGYNGTANQLTLAAWSHSFAAYQDQSSLSADPLFVAPASGNLHVRTDILSPLNGAALPVADVVTDIDGQARSPVAPDIGADEFIPGSTSITVGCQAGWNLLSLPVAVNDNRATTIFPSAVSKAFSFHGRYSADSLIVNGAGYWVKLNVPETIGFDGLPLTKDTIDVVAGWNIIGSVSGTVPVSSVTSIPQGIVNSSYYAYTGAYSIASAIIPGNGYWVKVSQSGKLILTSP